VRADAPYRTLQDFIEAAREHPGERKQSGGSITARDNVVRQLLQQSTGARWAFISFPGAGERVAALLGGHVDLMIIEPQEVADHIRAGKLRLLAQVNDRRLPGFPDVPTLEEAGFHIAVMPQMRGVVAPPGIPRENVEYWQEVFRKLTRTASWEKYVADNQFEDSYQQGAELATFLYDFTDRTRAVLARAGVKTVR
jgi:putative tricarboxylic transport membrane protein